MFTGQSSLGEYLTEDQQHHRAIYLRRIRKITNEKSAEKRHENLQNAYSLLNPIQGSKLGNTDNMEGTEMMWIKGRIQKKKKSCLTTTE